jgi:hypothetical protein
MCRLDFFELTITEHYRSRSSFLTGTGLAVKTALLRSPEAFAELPSQQIRRCCRSTSAFAGLR